MAKSKMNLKYKSQKRVRNKNKNEVEEKSEVKSTIITCAVVVGFIAIFYLGAYGLEKLGVFEKGYTKPEVTNEIGYNDILIGEVFNRPDAEYVVLFDTEGDKTNDVYVRYLADKYTTSNVYYVDMSEEQNKKYVSEESNSKARNVSELKINDITVVLIKNGKITKYITGSDACAEFFK